jgi:hypothetical protein
MHYMMMLCCAVVVSRPQEEELQAQAAAVPPKRVRKPSRVRLAPTGVSISQMAPTDVRGSAKVMTAVMRALFQQLLCVPCRFPTDRALVYCTVLYISIWWS